MNSAGCDFGVADNMEGNLNSGGKCMEKQKNELHTLVFKKQCAPKMPSIIYFYISPMSPECIMQMLTNAPNISAALCLDGACKIMRDKNC